MTATLLLAAALAATSTADYDALTAYDAVDLAPGIRGYFPKRADTPIVSGNSIAIAGDDAVLVVDSGHFPEATRRMIADIRRWAGPKKPVRYLVNTHWHPDHNKGNSLYADAFPGVTIIGTEATRLQFVNPFVKDESTMMRDQAVKVRKVLAEGKMTSGAPVTESTRTMFTEALREFDLSGADFATVTPLPPAVTFENKLVVHLGKRDVEVLFLGRGNTAGDTLVHVPDARLLATGDLVVFPAPYAFGSFIGEWGPTMRKVLALDAATIVPGHGPAMHDKSYLTLLAETFEALSGRVKKLADDGLSLDDARKKLDVADLRQRFTHGDEKVERAFDGYFLGPGVPRAYREAKEGPLKDET